MNEKDYNALCALTCEIFLPKPVKKFRERICGASVIWFEESSVKIVLECVG